MIGDRREEDKRTEKEVKRGWHEKVEYRAAMKDTYEGPT